MPYARNAVIARASSQLNTVADLKTIQVHTWLSQGQVMVKLAAELREVEEMLPLLLSPPDQPALTRAKLNLRLEINTLSDVFPLVRSVSLLHPDTGRVLVSTDPTLEGRDRRQEDYFREGRKGPFIGPVHYSLGREEPVLIVSAPVARPNGGSPAVVAAELNLSDLAAILGNRSGLGRSGEAYLVDYRGFFVTLPEKIEGGPLGVVARSTGVQRAIAGQSGLDTYADPRGVPVIGVYRWLASEKMALLVEVDESEVLGHIHTAWTLIAITALVLLAVSIVAAHKLSGWLGRPLAEITDAARALRGGDLSRRVPSDVRDEIGQLATAFNDMAEELERSYEGLEHIIAQRTAGLEQAEARLRSVVETASDAIVSVDDSAKIIMFNQAAERMLGCPASAAIGRPIGDFIAEQDCRPADPDAGSTPGLLVKLNAGMETSARRLDGQSFPAEISVSRTRVAGQTIHTIILRDITKRKQAEEQLTRLNEELEQRVEERTEELRNAQIELVKRERLSTLGQLTATVSHEIRNPLGVMRTSLYLIEKKLKDLDPAVQRSIERMKRSIHRCDRIIDELLDFSRAHNLAIEPTAIDDWLAGLIGEQPIRENVTLEIIPGCPDIEIGLDRERLRRAVINVLENAAQAIEAGIANGDVGAPGTVTVATRAKGGFVELSVSDTGPGVPEDVLSRVFEPLFSTKNFGVGLGLAVSKQIVEQHGGGIAVENQPGGGARFTFRLPLNQQARTKEMQGA